MATREEMNGLAKEVISSYEARVADLAALHSGVTAQRQAARSYILELGQARHATERHQRAELGRGRTQLASGVAGQLRELGATRRSMARQQQAGLAQSRADLASGVANKLNGLMAGRAAVGRAQRADLAKGRTHLTTTEALRRSRVLGWISEVSSANAGAREEWQDLASTMRSKRGGGPSVAQAPKPSSAPEALYTRPATPSVVEEEEELVAQAEVGYVTPEFANLSERFFEHLANHPDGSRLTELEQEFGMSRFEAARVIRRLIDEGKAEKRNLLYFAI